jgi:1,4-dihydroxy-2-naphthoate octaprenyltransferase
VAAGSYAPAVAAPLAARLIAFVKLGRPLFLVGGFVLHGLGAALAVAGGARFAAGRFFWGQVGVTAAQLMTHYCNDYFDLEADRANATPTRWSGGSRVLLDAGFPPRAALVAALALAACALAAGAALAARAPSAPLASPLLLVIVVLAWEYSAPPLRLCSSGVGELATALVVTVLVPLFGFYVQAGALAPVLVLLLAALPPAGLQFAMLLAIELPDAAGDAAAGKRTLVVRRGAPWAARLYAVVVAGSFLALPLLVWAGLPPLVAAGAALVAPLGAWQAARMAGGAFRDPGRWESLAFWSVAQLVATAAAELAGALLTIGC